MGMDKDNDASRKITFKAKNTLTKQGKTSNNKNIKSGLLKK